MRWLIWAGPGVAIGAVSRGALRRVRNEDSVSAVLIGLSGPAAVALYRWRFDETDLDRITRSLVVSVRASS